MADQEALVRDIMVDVFDFPHVPYWFTLRQVTGILKKSAGGSKCLRPLAVLVFDEKYNFVGHLDAERLLKGIGDTLFADAGRSVLDGSNSIMTELSERPASTLLIKTAFFADPEDRWEKAADLMLRNNLQILPVLENQKKLVGLVRQTEIFDRISALYFRA